MYEKVSLNRYFSPVYVTFSGKLKFINTSYNWTGLYESMDSWNPDSWTLKVMGELQFAMAQCIVLAVTDLITVTVSNEPSPSNLFESRLSEGHLTSRITYAAMHKCHLTDLIDFNFQVPAVQLPEKRNRGFSNKYINKWGIIIGQIEMTTTVTSWCWHKLILADSHCTVSTYNWKLFWWAN